MKLLSPEQRKAYLTSLSESEAAALLHYWPFWARPNQVPPDPGWHYWLILAGRGFGKTRTGAEWVRAEVGRGAARHIALVGPTAHDVRATMVEGESGLLAICPDHERPDFEPSKNRLTWPCGARATLFSADQPDRLRGPQHDIAWADELCAWRQAQSAWDMLMFGLRLGSHPRCCITTTPKPSALLETLLNDPATHVTRGSSFDNAQNLAPSFLAEITAKYEGTRLGRQELHAEVLLDVAGALWSRDQLAVCMASRPSAFDRLVVAVDPPATSGPDADACGIVVAGRLGSKAYVLEDLSLKQATPLEWARRAVAAYHEYQADRLVAETNQGGEMVEAILRQIDAGVAVRRVHASRGKKLRAEPVAALYEQNRVFHCASMPDLEDEMCRFTGAASDTSPDRLDALVWALTDLLLGVPSTPNLRSL